MRRAKNKITFWLTEGGTADQRQDYRVVIDRRRLEEPKRGEILAVAMLFVDSGPSRCRIGRLNHFCDS